MRGQRKRRRQHGQEGLQRGEVALVDRRIKDRFHRPAIAFARLSRDGERFVVFQRARERQDPEGKFLNDFAAQVFEAGVWLSGTTWTTAGQAGRALSFDGVNDRVNVNDATSLDLTGGMTLEAWVYPTALSGWRTVVLKEMAGGLVYALYAHDNAPHSAADVCVSGVDVTVDMATPVP